MAEPVAKKSLGKRIWLKIAPDAGKDEDGRDNFNSRGQYVLCAMGGAVGLGNLLRFPSVIYNNYGLQFFIPYFVALFLIGIPILCLEIVIGQAYRAGCVGAWNSVNHRAKGLGLSMVFNGYSVVGYYVPILAWAMVYFRHSFTSPLPWSDMEAADFFNNEVVKNPPPVGDPETEMISYPGSGVVGETVAWVFFTWFINWMCMFKGVGLTGRVIYVTMALPLILIFILAVRSLSLPNASDGFALYVGTWRSESLQGPGVWQDAFGQMFFSIGVGFGYFVSYASYASKHSNAVQDAFIIALSNSAIEIISALAVMGIVGYLGMNPAETDRLSTFSSGFYTYPTALAQMPGSNFFSALFFITLWLLGLTCVFALFEVMVTMIVDTDWGKKIPRPAVVTIVAIASFLISMLYASEVGFMLLDAIDTFVNDIALFYTVWSECMLVNTLYRWRDPVDQIGGVGYSVYNAGFVLAQFLGFLIGHLVSPGVGAGVGFAVFIISIVATVFISKTPSIPAPGFWGKNAFLQRLWYAAFYSGNQFRRDINRNVLTGNNWKLHPLWPVILKYVTGPAVGLVLSFAYPKFKDNFMYNNPPYLYSFVLMHIVIIFITVFFVFPSWGNFLIPEPRRVDGKFGVNPQGEIGEIAATGAPRPVDVEGIDNRHDVTTHHDSGSEPKVVQEKNTAF
jgi:solute carrier family 6 GABA transporter-like protein 1